MPKWIAIPALVLLFCVPPALFAWVHYPALADGKIHIRYMSWGNPEQQGADEEMLKRFEAIHPDIKVDFMMIPASMYFQKILVMLSSGTEPDVFRMDHFYTPKYFQYGGYFENLDPYIAADTAKGTFNIHDFFPKAINEVRWNGSIYGMNVLYGGKILYYNKTMFKNAGLPDPHDLFLKGEWDDAHFLQACQALTKFDRQGRPQQYGVRLAGDDLWWMVWGFGGDIIKADGSIHTTDAKTVAALKFYANMLRGSMGPGLGVSPLPGEGIQGAFTFESGTLGMTSGWAGESPRCRRLCNFEWDIVPVPAGPGGHFPILKGTAALMSPHSKHKEAAWELIKYIVSAETETWYCGDSMRRGTPSRMEVANSQAFLGATRAPFNTDTFADLNLHGHQLPITPRWSEWNGFMYSWIDRMNRGACTPEQAAAGLALDIRNRFAELDRVQASLHAAAADGAK